MDCPAPFLSRPDLPLQARAESGQICFHTGTTDCCLPCPASTIVFGNSLDRVATASQALAVLSLVGLGFLLLSYAVLDRSESKVHFLNVGLVVAIALEVAPFVVSIPAKPHGCIDRITPSSASSDLGCALTGPLLAVGCFAVVGWLFARALTMHLNLVWDIPVGLARPDQVEAGECRRLTRRNRAIAVICRRYPVVCQVVCWGLAVLFAGLTARLVGFSARFGPVCHVNSVPAADTVFWGPILTISAAAALLQLISFTYCLYICLRRVWVDKDDDADSSIVSGTNEDVDVVPTVHSPGISPPHWPGNVARGRVDKKGGYVCCCCAKQCGRTSTSSVLDCSRDMSRLRCRKCSSRLAQVHKVVFLQWRPLLLASFIIVDTAFIASMFIRTDRTRRHRLDVAPLAQCLSTAAATGQSAESSCRAILAQFFPPVAVAGSILILLTIGGIQAFVLLFHRSILAGWRRRLSAWRCW